MLVSTENFTHGENFKFRQHQVLALFQHHKAGLTIEELVTRLDISRTAVNQHLVSMERDGLIKNPPNRKVQACAQVGRIKSPTKGSIGFPSKVPGIVNLRQI